MCTAINLIGNRHLFGRTMDYECSFGEEIVTTPRGFSYGSFTTQKAIIGVATVIKDMPLYFDGMNESGLCGAGLNFPGYAVYHTPKKEKINLRSYELLPYILGLCNSVKEARKLLENINLLPDSVCNELAATPLHWIFADQSGALTVESVADGLKIYENSVGVLTNAPEFSYHITNLSNFMGLSRNNPKNQINIPDLSSYSRGMGALGLPGDFSSASRFVRASFLKNNTSAILGVNGEINRFFHIIDSLSIPLGAVITDEAKDVCTLYTSLADPMGMAYHYTTYNAREIKTVKFNPVVKEIVINKM